MLWVGRAKIISPLTCKIQMQYFYLSHTLSLIRRFFSESGLPSLASLGLTLKVCEIKTYLFVLNTFLLI